MVPQKTTKLLTPKLQVESLLFSAGKTMSEDALVAFTKLDPRTVKKALQTLQQEYEGRDSALAVFNDESGWKMMVREAYVPIVKNIVADTELSRACMETLAVIAYKYPKVLQSEVVDIRGSGAYDHMAELERLGFIARDPSGRSYAIKLTERFFNYFDVAGGKDIREVFKNVKVPQKIAIDAQKTLGQLSVVDVPKEEHNEKKLGDMEVVEIQEQKNDEEPKVSALQSEEHSKFLDDLDKKIAALSSRNDENDNDETLKRKPLPGSEELHSNETKTDSNNTAEHDETKE